MSIKRKLYYISALLCVNLLLSACSGKASPETAAETEESSTPETESSVETSEETVTTSIKETSEAEEENKVTKYNFTDILNQVAQKGSDWSSLPLSDNFRNTYNSENGIIERNNYEELEPLIENEKSNYKEKFMTFNAVYTYDPERIFRIVYRINFKLDEENRLDLIEVIEGEEIDMKADPPDKPVYIDEENYEIVVWSFVGREGEGDVEFAVTDKFRNYYKDYEGIGLLPKHDYEDLIPVYDLSSRSEKKVVLDAVYADKIIRYNAYFTTDSELRLDSITVEEDSVRDREPESEAE